MTQEQGITDVITRLQGSQHGFAGAIQAALQCGLTATQIGSLTDLKVREVSALIASWDLVPEAQIRKDMGR